MWSEGSPREYRFLVLLEQEDFSGYVARKLHTTVSSLEELAASLKIAFSINFPIQISYYNHEYQSYVAPSSLSEVPTKGKIKARNANRRKFTEG